MPHYIHSGTISSEPEEASTAGERQMMDLLHDQVTKVSMQASARIVVANQAGQPL